MRNLSSAISLLLENSTDIQTFYIVDLENSTDSPTSFFQRKHNTLLRNIVLDGFTYYGGGTADPDPPETVDYGGGNIVQVEPCRLISLEPPRVSAAVDRQAYTLKYADPEFKYRPAFEAGYNGANVKIRLAFINTTDGALGSGTPVDPGQPMLNAADIIVAFEGKVDRQAYDIQPNESVIVTVECTSPMGQLSLTRGAYTSRDWMAQVDPGVETASRDVSFDQIHQGSKGFSLLWGKI